MNELELKKLWQETNEKLERSFEINKKNTEEISGIKAHHFLNSMKPLKIFTLLVGLVWVGAGASILTRIYLYAFSEANKFFLFSATAQVSLTAIALFIYVYQLSKIYQVEISDPILQTQERLAQLKVSTLLAAKILFLQLPVWTTFWWNNTMFTNWNLFQWALPLTITLLFAYVACWLFFNIKFENRNKKWFKLIFNGKEWTPLMKSLELLEQVNEYK